MLMGLLGEMLDYRLCIIIGVLIRKETFIREFLSSLSADIAMLNFFLEPQKNKYAEEFTIINIPEKSPIWRLLGLMVLEYANKTPDTQKVLWEASKANLIEKSWNKDK